MMEGKFGIGMKRMNDQLQLEHISAHLDELNKIIKDEKQYGNLVITDSGSHSKLSSNADSVKVITLDSIKITPEVLHKWFWAAHYRKKHTDYKRLFKKITKEFTSITELGGAEYISSSRGKIELVDKAIEYADYLSLNYDEQIEKAFAAIERELCVYLTHEELKVLQVSGEHPSSDISILKIYAKKLRHDLRYLVRKLSPRKKRDIRNLFRTIVRFLFKNMDDESDVDNLFIFKSHKKRSFNIKNYCPWTKKKSFYNLKIY